MRSAPWFKTSNEETELLFQLLLVVVSVHTAKDGNGRAVKQLIQMLSKKQCMDITKELYSATAIWLEDMMVVRLNM